MTLQIKGGARVPGPLGVPPSGTGGRFPGPIGTPLWDQKTSKPDQSTLTKVTKKTVMPFPTNEKPADNKDVHVVDWPLFTKEPAFTEVKQAPLIANCPVAAILAAMAFTSVGRRDIKAMLSENSGNVLTDLSSLPVGTLSNPPSGTTISSSRSFNVKVDKDSIDVSDVLYTDDHDAGWSPLYLRDPGDHCIWAAIIEKALAVKLKGYESFMTLDISANDFWEKITGVQPGGIEIKADTPLNTIIEKAKASTTVPTIGASKPDSTDVEFVSEFHGFSMLGLKGSEIQLYDPAKAKTILISPANFRHDFQAILFRRT
jgi:hypothetical protein